MAPSLRSLPSLWMALALAGCSPARGVPIFLWHSVAEGVEGDDHDVSADEFARELSAVDESGASAVSLDQLFDARSGGTPLPERAVVLTFDDGRACLKGAAQSLLLEHHLSAELFVVTDRIGQDEAHRFVEKDDHGAHPYLLWPELAQMVASGAFHVQSHSVTHRRHTELTPEQMREELTASRRRITEELGVPSNFYAFPFGGFDTRYRDLAEEVGYRGALSVGKGPGTRYGLLRHSLLKGDEHVLRSVLQSELGAPSRR